ncbi:unnamed protein product [Rotaria sp. Silwood1]|nr:unnamed protein product [Rotaria sp. Silwood1]
MANLIITCYDQQMLNIITNIFLGKEASKPGTNDESDDVQTIESAKNAPSPSSATSESEDTETVGTLGKALTKSSTTGESEDVETVEDAEEAPTASRTTSESENAETVEAAELQTDEVSMAAKIPKVETFTIPETVPSSRTLQTEETDGDIAVGDGTSIPDVAVEKEVEEFPTKETGYKHNMINSNNNNGNLYGTL